MGNDLELLNLAEERSGGRYPPRLLFDKGIAVKGSFQPYMSLAEYTEADFLCDPYQVTPAMVRFSMASGQSGSGDTCRDLRAMEVKLYTREGNCDLISLSLPEGMCSSGEDFFQLADELKPSERTGLRDQCGYLRYAADHPQALSGVLRLYGAKGLPSSYASMESWAAGTMLWKNRAGDGFFLRHGWVPEEPPKYLSENEGEFLCGFDPDSMGRKLVNRLCENKPPAFELRLHLIPIASCRGREGRYCDPALAWPEEEGIRLRAGRLTLEALPEEPVRCERLLCCSPDTVVSGMAIPEGTFLHQMAVSIRALQSARLGRERTAASVNLHHRRQRPAIRTEVMRISQDRDSPPEIRAVNIDSAPYYAQARRLWNGTGEQEKMRIAGAFAQRLLFGPDELQNRFLEEMEKIDLEIAKSIEKQLLF